jgi:molybdenum cofactor synthesis domain-containing protein
MRDKTAAMIVIGNEILSGKVADSNAVFLARELRGLGVSLERILVIPDDLEAIADAVREYQPKYDVVFTSGGVGPTHDDVTVSGIARGLGRPVVSHPEIESTIRRLVGDSINAAHLKMAEVPEGANVIFQQDQKFPIVQVDNIFVLPGIPEIFREKLQALRPLLAVDPYFLRIVFLNAYESSIAGFLDETLAAFPQLQLGSYPKLGDPEYRVRITLESKDEEYVNQALEHLVSKLPQGMIVRTE